MSKLSDIIDSRRRQLKYFKNCTNKKTAFAWNCIKVWERISCYYFKKYFIGHIIRAGIQAKQFRYKPASVQWKFHNTKEAWCFVVRPQLEISGLNFNLFAGRAIGAAHGALRLRRKNQATGWCKVRLDGTCWSTSVRAGLRTSELRLFTGRCKGSVRLDEGLMKKKENAA